jgi:hypothetical protein
MAKRKRLTPLPQPPAPDPEAAPPEARAIGPGVQADGARGARPLPPIAGMAHNAALSAAAEELAETLRAAREGGRFIADLPLSGVDTDYLVRDRIASDPVEMRVLMDSLRARGQQTPIEVTPLSGERFGLISGWRRLTALRQLRAETGEPRFDTVQALIRRPQDSAEAYLAMVEENEIRVGLSYYERARIVARTVAQGAYPDTSAALRGLFHAASRPKRSKIRSFIPVVEAFDGALRFPEAIGERLGLRLAQALATDPSLGARLRAEMETQEPEDAAAELRLLEAALGAARAVSASPDPVEPRPGIRLETGRDGTLKLSGPGVDATLRARLLDWLKG